MKDQGGIEDNNSINSSNATTQVDCNADGLDQVINRIIRTDHNGPLIGRLVDTYEYRRGFEGMAESKMTGNPNEIEGLTEIIRQILRLPQISLQLEPFLNQVSNAADEQVMGDIESKVLSELDWYSRNPRAYLPTHYW